MHAYTHVLVLLRAWLTNVSHVYTFTEFVASCSGVSAVYSKSPERTRQKNNTSLASKYCHL